MDFSSPGGTSSDRRPPKERLLFIATPAATLRLLPWASALWRLPPPGVESGAKMVLAAATVVLTL